MYVGEFILPSMTKVCRLTYFSSTVPSEGREDFDAWLKSADASHFHGLKSSTSGFPKGKGRFIQPLPEAF
jgi:hypothetical protein